MSSPWAFHLHAATWVVLLAVTAVYAWVVREPRFGVTKRQAMAFVGGVAVLLVGLTWPVADLAEHRLLLALVVQRLLLMLAAPPLLITGIPVSLMVRATRHRVVDDAVHFLLRPVPAIAVVTVLAVGTLSTVAVDAQSSSLAARAALDAVLLVAGLVLWLPVRRTLPGTPSMSALGRAGYLLTQSIVPSFLAFVWIFARHPLYPVYAHVGRTFGMSPVLDQQLAGFAAKLGTVFVLWSVAFVTVHRSERQPEGREEAPLSWAHVDRQLERAERQARRRSALPLPPRWGGTQASWPIPSTGLGPPGPAQPGSSRPSRPDASPGEPGPGEQGQGGSPLTL